MFSCPSTLDECTEAVMKLLPRGRAWSTHEGTPERSMVASFDPEFFNPDYFAATDEEGATIWNYFRAFSEILFFFYTRVCDLRREFWCHSLVDTRDDWMKEYGLPDECDPFPDLCVKVSAIGGTRCEYYQEVAQRAGWSIDCVGEIESCGRRVGCDSRVGDGSTVGASVGYGQLKIVVYLDESPAFQPANDGGYIYSNRVGGGKQVGLRLACDLAGPNLLPLQCLLSRVIHAEIFTVYEVRYGN